MKAYCSATENEWIYINDLWIYEFYPARFSDFTGKIKIRNRFIDLPQIKFIFASSLDIITVYWWALRMWQSCSLRIIVYHFYYFIILFIFFWKEHSFALSPARILAQCFAVYNLSTAALVHAGVIYSHHSTVLLIR